MNRDEARIFVKLMGKKILYGIALIVLFIAAIAGSLFFFALVGTVMTGIITGLGLLTQLVLDLPLTEAITQKYDALEIYFAFGIMGTVLLAIVISVGYAICSIIKTIAHTVIDTWQRAKEIAKSNATKD